ANGSFAVHALILPFIEQDNLYKAIDFKQSSNAAANAPTRATAVAIFLCPSDPARQPPPGLAGNNYRANEGTSILNNYGPGDTQGVNNGMPPPNGGFFVDSRYRFADVTDGTSNTAAFSEHPRGDFSDLVSTYTDTFQPGTYPATADQAMADCA